MPCYLFTWHTYGSWLPDRPQGYVHWSRGLQPSSPRLALCYRKEQRDSTVQLGETQQRAIIEELMKSALPIRYRLHSVASDKTHIHVLASWLDKRPWKRLCRSMRRSMSQCLNRQRKRRWFSRGGHSKQVLNRSHYDHLVFDYLPSHSGWKYAEEKGIYL